LSWDCIG